MSYGPPLREIYLRGRQTQACETCSTQGSTSFREIAQRYSASNRFADICFLAILLIGYAGCFCIGEILTFIIDAFKITSDCILIYLNKRKNGQFRQGHSSTLIRTSNITWPLAGTEKSLPKLPTGCSPRAPLIRRIVKSKSNAKQTNFMF